MNTDEVVRGEVLGDDRLCEFAQTLAADAGQHAGRPADFDVGRTLRQSWREIRQACQIVETAVRDERAITQSARWLIENIHVVEAQLADLPEALPRRTVRRLPGGSASRQDWPRIFELTLGYVRHSDSRFDPVRLSSFVAAYQRTESLQMNELWALPAILRLVLLLNLARVATRTARALNARALADRAADAAIVGSDNDVEVDVLLHLPERTLRGPFLVQLAERLRFGGHGAVHALARLNDALAGEGRTLDDLVRDEYSNQGTNNVTARNIITSFRDIAAHDWREFFESTSCVEAILHELPSYANCDFLTRDRYRGAVEELARAARCPEKHVAAEAAAICAAAPPESQANDVGFHFIAGGRANFERRLKISPTLPQRSLRWAMRYATGAYLVALALLTTLLLGSSLVAGFVGHETRGSLWWALALVAVIHCSELALALLNRSMMWLFPPRRLPRLALRDGIPAQSRTLVVVPVMVANEKHVRAMLRQLEIHAIANSDEEACFALLSDWPDAQQEHLPADAVLLETLRDGIARLNAKYPTGNAGDARFFVLHRRRQWNAGERCWMGWERKRGKLSELNQLLLGGNTSFIPDAAGIVAAPQRIRYVVTLDADTRLPYGAVARLVGIASHPLNQPRLDVTGRRVIGGYGVIQPRVVPLLPRQGERSLYRSVVTGASGMDPYAGTISDVYQDVFGEGIFTGKGLYDLATFERVMSGRVPENTLLSHDLLEGLFARCALASDVECFEDFPSHSEVGAARLHRWTRGDWQLLPWLLTRRGADIPPLGKWKIYDNLRRSLVAPAAIVTLLLAWAQPDSRAWLWLLLIVAPTLVPSVFSSMVRIVNAASDRLVTVSLRRELSILGADLRNALVAIALLAQNAWLMLDAIGRALLRQFVTRRHRLEWLTAAQAQSVALFGLRNFSWSIKGATIIVLISVGALMTLDPAGLPRAAPLLLLWWLAPLLARRMSLAPDHGRHAQATQSRLPLRRIARRSFRYFTTFVTREQHWLPPDNFQETPVEVVAHRTSPTNIGLYLLACATAQELGWVGLRRTVETLTATFGTLAALQRERGHFYNWYDTQTCQPLEPRYVSTVDSGNLCGNLLALAQWSQQARDRPISLGARAAGLGDTLALLRDALQVLPAGPRSSIVGIDEINQCLATAERLLARMTQADDLDSSAVHLFAECTQQISDLIDTLASERGDAARELTAWSHLLTADALSHVDDLQPANAISTRQMLKALATQCEAFVSQMDFRFLFDSRHRLFSIGWRSTDQTLDSSYYDLLASEARLASFVAIAKGDVPARHWAHLGRRLTGKASAPLLVSWSGSMFEYLMPALIMREPPDGLLDTSARRAVEIQQNYAVRRNVPWGISEAAYNVRDAELTYQYAPFGVPGLGLKRWLERNVVIAPYATALAAMYRPAAAVSNFARLAALGGLGRFGFYESLDFTRERLPEGTDHEVIRAFMAHHQGMTVLALANAVQNAAPAGSPEETGMRHYFHSDVRVQAAELLLEEQAPGPAAQPRTLGEREIPAHILAESPEIERQISNPAFAPPSVQLLSNRHYAVMLTASGGGYSVWEGQAVTRWREDATTDVSGSWLYLRDIDDGQVWSATYQPTPQRPEAYLARFCEERATFERQDGTLRSLLEVIVASDDDAELRQLTLHNDGSSERCIEVTSYAEIVLAPLAADIAHRAFSNMFVQTEWIAGSRGTLLAHRRPRNVGEAVFWAGHVVAGPPSALDTLQYETDRSRFVGRGSDVTAPVAVLEGRPLSNSAGSVLDPIFSLRVLVRVPPRGSCQLVFSSFIAGSRDAALRIADKYRQRETFASVAMQAWTYSRAGLHHLRVELAEARLFQMLAGQVIFAGSRNRADRELLATNSASYADLWRFSISGDRPIVLVRCSDLRDMDAVQQVLRAQEYWRTKQLIVDVVLLNELAHSYEQELQLALEEAVRTARAWSSSIPDVMRPGAFAIAGRSLTPRDHTLLLTVARATIVPGQGSLAEQITRSQLPVAAAQSPATPQHTVHRGNALAAGERDTTGLEYFNGFGGFAEDGGEYVISLADGRQTPQPWCNVMANSSFGALISESGAGCSWAGNSRENQLTPWSNDAVSDPAGEAFYIRDEVSGLFWSPTVAPLRLGDARYRSAHGQGYSRFECAYHGIDSELSVWVDAAAPLKWYALKLTNSSAIARRLSVTGYVEWSLGSARAANAPFIITERDAQSGALLARNPWNRDFSECVAWFDLQGVAAQWTGSRREFLGQHGSLAQPSALLGSSPLSGRTGPGYDPCAALRTTLRLERGASITIVFTLGQASDRATALSFSLAARAIGAEKSLASVRAAWESRLGRIQIRTPDRALDLLVNRWLLYQVTSCRLWGRAGFYQAGGAYGFRDQLQDTLALLVTAPALARDQILLAAGRQFPEGDVQHWWHPPTGRGVRTRSVDDRVWLPYVTAKYLEVTGDTAILQQSRPFLLGDALRPEQEDAHFLPAVSEFEATLYEHCARALDISLAAGANGLPLMGGGDWNDGMNRVGLQGRGESVWMAWFLIVTLTRFAAIAERRDDSARAAVWRGKAESFRQACEVAAWDGAWYRRAFFDDGTPLGSASNVECRIDSLAQTWAVLSGAAEPERAARAMDSVSEYLVRDADDLILLFTPPFDHGTVDPGYIRSYPPGLRENGGQYSHAAVWALMAYAQLGRSGDVAELLAALNPIHRSATRRGSAAYMVEPYVMAADIYSEAPHARRGGWTWYTGAAGWMYNAVIESVLGVRIRHDGIQISPCLPSSWPSCELHYRQDGTDYRILLNNGGGGREVVAMTVDGEPVLGTQVPLLRDGREHLLEVQLR